MGFLKKLERTVRRAIKGHKHHSSSTTVVVRKDNNIDIRPPVHASTTAPCTGDHCLGEKCTLKACRINAETGDTQECTIEAACRSICGCFVDSGTGVVVTVQ